MRFSTVFISSAFVLASMTVALPTKRENMLLARFADSGFLAEVDARAYDEESELYARAHHGDHRDHDTREKNEIPEIDPTELTNGHPRLRRSNVSNQLEARAYGKEPELYARQRVPNGPHRDHDTREWWLFGDANPRPNRPTGPTNGHPRPRRSNVSNQVEARAYGKEPELYARQRVPNGPHRDHDTREWWMVPVTDSRPNQPTEPTNGHPRPGLRPFNVSPNRSQ